MCVFLKFRVGQNFPDFAGDWKDRNRLVLGGKYFENFFENKLHTTTFPTA